VHGIGLFADEDIARGRLVWEFHPSVDIAYTEEQWQALQSGAAPESLEQVRKYSYKEGGRYIVCIDNAQFMNHRSEEPNVVNDKLSNTMRAVRDILRGEELFCDYSEYCDGDDCNLQAVS